MIELEIFKKIPFGLQTSFHLDRSFLKPNNINSDQFFQTWRPHKYKPVIEC